MANYLLCVCLLRIVLPICLTLSIIFRPSVLSAMYLLLLLYLPIVPVPTPRSMQGHTGTYLKIVICVSFITSIAQFVFQIVLLSMPPYGYFLDDCNFLEKLLRHIGLIKLNSLYAIDVIQWLSPEIIMLISSISVYSLCAKLMMTHSEGTAPSEIGLQNTAKQQNKTTFSFHITVGKYISLASLCIAGCLRPSIPGIFYFLIFLGGATFWSCCKELRNVFAYVLRFVLVVVFVHISALYAYQFQWPQEYLDANSTYARYFGLTPIITVQCGNPRSFIYSDLEWASYINPIWLLWLYYIMALESKLLLMPQLIRGGSPTRKYADQPKSTSILQDSTGSITVTGDGQDDIPMHPIGKEEELQSGFWDNVVYGMASVFQILIRSSYIATNITMMAWSITYHSWLTFVLLIWANLLWLLPNQRRAMLRSAPFLVLYSQFLLLSAYIYGMNLTEEELPSKIQNINLAQIGFEKILVLPCKPLLVKCLYTTMFWITLRQFMHERQEAKQTSALTDLVAPLQVTVGPTTTAPATVPETTGSKMIKTLGEYVKKILTKFWIWVVAINLFVVAITGDRMTGFRIIYMFLFLIFILTLQISFRLWRKMMYGFWIIVIGYSMLTLVLVYTYQFDHFSEYWENYLHIPPEQQLDIGLETYETKQLFVRLLTPTFFVVITVVQVHYFHKDFLDITDVKRYRNSVIPETEIRSQTSSAQGALWGSNSESSDTVIKRPRVQLKDLRNKQKIIQLLSYLYEELKKICAYVWLFLEIHIVKVVILIALLLTIYDVCAIHFAIVFLSVIAVSSGRNVQTISIHLTSVIVSVMMLARMVYQIKYMDHSKWEVNCNNGTNGSMYNNAEWLGFRKIESGSELPSLVKWYMGFILVATVRAIVLIRQHLHRLRTGRTLTRQFFMFPHIDRANADKNLKNCLMYLVNYGFYKFGVEVCLMATVALIGTRMDFYALLYGIWLSFMFIMSRNQLHRIWNFYLCFVAFVLPLQYFMVVGLPPGLCIDFPWDSTDETLRRMQDWMFLLDTKYPPSSHKLICDIIVLILVSRQSIVFRIENRHKDYESDYPGGSNKSIDHLMEDPTFINPVPDFITYIRTWLDIFKREILLGFIYVTLAIVFLAGTNRVNLFSIGYLIGSFIFLWQGSDLYLRPIPKILHSWNILLGYNVFVIIIKTVLQIAGCIFINDIQECWLLRLFGIGCIKKFGNSVSLAGITDPTYCTPVPREDIGLAWDGLCFGFLLMQRRIFNSFNFFHIVDETKATTILASRGAELIADLRNKQMSQQHDVERKILEKIKQKMDKIKATQQKIKGPSYKEATSHFVAIRSGDYYMFDELDDDDELDVIDEKEDDITEDDIPLASPSKAAKMTVGEESPRRTDIGHFTIHEEPKADELGHGSSQVPEEEMSLLSDIQERKKETKLQCILRYFLFIWGFIESLMNTCTNYLNKFSRDYRYVLRVLTKEKRLLKERTGFRIGMRRGSNQIWHPSGSYQTLVNQTRSPNEQGVDSIEYDHQPSSLEPIIRNQSHTTKSQSESHVDIMADFETAEMSSVDQPPFIRLLHAIWFAILSHSDIVCYIIIFLNQMKSASVLSLPLPLMVFLWGTLTVPRPSKSFWITIIAYTEVIVLIKCVFQFKILDDNPAHVNNPFYAPRIIGIERTNNYATYDLLLILVVFFHRIMLKSLGLWKSSYEPPPPIVGELYKREDVPDDIIYETDESQRTKSSPESQLTKLEPQEDSEMRSSKSLIQVTTTEIGAMDHIANTWRMASEKYTETFKQFFAELLDPTSRITADVYAYMFMCDFFNFMVVIFGFAAFGTQQGDGGVSAYLQENKVPIPFLLMLILQFILIIVDRALFLRKYILGKIIFQYLQIIGVHIWMFFVLPAVTERSFNARLPPQMWYMVKCFYLLLSAYQIRCGYPTRILGNFVCKGYNYMNMFLFKAFMTVPFLFELRTIMDWMWTDTSMTIFDWLKMEDIFAHIFQLKCSRHVESEYPQPRGEKKKVLVKYFMGGAGLFAIIAIIWFPLVFFALGNTVGEANVPYDVTINLRIGTYQPIYSMSAQTNRIYRLSESEYEIMMNNFNKKNRVAQTFLASYEHEDVAAVMLNGNSTMVWAISPPDLERMLDEVKSKLDLILRLQYIISRVSNNKQDTGIISSEIAISIPAEVEGNPNPSREMLEKMLLGDPDVTPVEIQQIFPKFIKVTNRAIATPITQLLTEGKNNKENSLRNLDMKLSRSTNTSNMTTTPMWWELRENCTDANYRKIIKKLPHANCDYLVLYTFNEKSFPASLSFLTGGGIISLYTTLVFVASRMIRGFFSEICFKIMFDDMPNVDRVLQLCLDIYLVREARELCLEEDLFAKVVFLFRSPETLIKWTRPKEEDENEADDPDDAEPQRAIEQQ